MNPASHQAASPGRTVIVHPLVVRLTHWVNAFAIVCMVMSGWGIYDASPLFGFRFPAWTTVGGWLGGSIAWHLAAMWLLVCNGLVYIVYGLLSRHFRQAFLPLRPAGIWRDFVAALRFRLVHRAGSYNAVQRLLYVAVLLAGVLALMAAFLALFVSKQMENRQIFVDLAAWYWHSMGALWLGLFCLLAFFQ